MFKERELIFEKGFSLIGALLLVVIVTATVAVLGTLIVHSQRLTTEVKVYKTTKEAAESAAYAITNTIDSEGDIPVNCTDKNTGAPCSVGCNASSDCICKIEWDSDPLLQKIKESIEKSLGETPEGYLLANCTQPDGTVLYTIEVIVPSKSGTKTTVYFIYQK